MRIASLIALIISLITGTHQVPTTHVVETAYLIPQSLEVGSPVPTVIPGGVGLCPAQMAGETVDHCQGGHPIDAQGFVLDGTPQLDDAHCVGTVVQRFDCLAARHPAEMQRLIDSVLNQAVLVSSHPPTTSCGADVERWRPIVAQYNWPVDTMLRIMCRESRGQPGAINRSSGACGLLQDLPGYAGCLDGPTNIRYSYYQKYIPGGLAPWGD